jgi:hypothetical protein
MSRTAYRSSSLFVISVLALAPLAFGGLPEGFAPTGVFGESQRQWRSDSGIRILVNAPADIDPAKPTLLILYTMPNGNTIEQTLGFKLAEGLDWHFDIQHIAAQTRKLRRIDADENIVVACLEAKGLSFPTWRKEHADHPRLARDLVDSIEREVPGSPIRIVLGAHSGGGGFISSYITGGPSIPDRIDRIVYLDANYSYSDDENHGDKLLAWLKTSPRHHLIVFAYDDRDVVLNGKKIVSDTGGTWRASHRMIDRLSNDADLEESQHPPFVQYAGMERQIIFYLHTNPEKKILHTRLVELNGLLEALTIGTALEDHWDGQFWGDRAYVEFIQPAPATQPSSMTAPAPVATTATAPAAPSSASIPPRPKDAVEGSAFMKQIASLPLPEREAAIAREITGGNIPRFLRQWKTIHAAAEGLDGRKHEAIYQVMPDYLAIGSDEDFVRVPMLPATAAKIARQLGCNLPTRKMVDQIYAAAEVKLEPRPLVKDRETIATFVQHHEIIESQRKGKALGPLVAGIKKDIILSNLLKQYPTNVIIYGWHKLDGKPIQPPYGKHKGYYVDYSHGVRLVDGTMTVDGVTRRVQDVLKDPELCPLLSDEGPILADYP